MNFLNSDGHGDDGEDDYDAANARCKHCGTDGLTWVDTGQRWRLLEGRTFHVCRPTDEGFGVVKP